MTFRQMKPSDYPDLVSLWSAFDGTTMTGADTIEGFERFLIANGNFCFVAELGGNVVGSVMAGTDSRRGYIYHLAVSESSQGCGIGGNLMSKVEQALKASGIEKAHLFIYADNPAIEFYRKTGWHTRQDIQVMSKVLIGEEYLGTRKRD